MIIGRRSTSQARETRGITERFEKQLDRETAPAAREITRRNNDYLAEKRRKVTKSIRRPR